MQRLWNAVSNHLAQDGARLTSQIESAVQRDMRKRYSSHWWVDDGFSASTLGCIVSNRQPAPQPTVPRQEPALILACAAVAGSLMFLIALVVMGGLDLG